MAIRLLPDGTYEFDTVSEAVEFRHLSVASRRESTPKKSAIDSAVSIVSHAINGSSLQSVHGFVDSLHNNQRALLTVLAKSESELTTERLAEVAGMDAGAVGPTMRHIRERAEKFGLDPDTTIRTRKSRGAPGERLVSAYSLSPLVSAELLKEMLH